MCYELKAIPDWYAVYSAPLAEGFDTAEKRTIGALWEQKSDGKGLFIIAEKTVDGKDVRQQLMEKIGDV